MKRFFVSMMLAALALLVGLPVQAQNIRPLASVQVLAHSATVQSWTGSTANTPIVVINIPGGVIGPDGGLRVTAVFSSTNNANTKSFQLSFGGVAAGTVGLSNTAGGSVVWNMWNRQSNLAQMYTSRWGWANASTHWTTAISTSSIDTRSDQSLVISCILAVASDTCAVESYTVELLKP